MVRHVLRPRLLDQEVLTTPVAPIRFPTRMLMRVHLELFGSDEASVTELARVLRPMRLFEVPVLVDSLEEDPVAFGAVEGLYRFVVSFD